MLGFYITPKLDRTRNGFNFYPISDNISFGFRFRMRNFVQYVRYSKRCKKWDLNRAFI